MNRKKHTTLSLNKRLLSGYCFLSFLVIQSVLMVFNHFGFYQSFTKNTNIFWGVGAGISGALFIWFSQKRLQELEKQNWQSLRKNEKIARQKFQKQYPLIAGIPILGFLVQKWQAEPLASKLALIGLCLLGSTVYLYDLSYYDWLPDEPLVVETAKGYLETGSYIKWDFWMDQAGTEWYGRAWPHTWMVAQSIKVLGLSEWSTRLVSAIFGILFILVIYGVTNFFFQNRWTAFLVTFVCILQPYFVVYFRRVRMYAVLVPIFVLLYYLAYQAITTKKTYPLSLYRNDWVKKYINYDWGLMILTLITFYLSLKIHVLSLVLLPPLSLLVMYLLIIKKQVRLWWPFLIGAIAMGIIILNINYTVLFSILGRFFTFFSTYQPYYIANLLAFLFPTPFSIVVLLLGCMLVGFAKIKTRILAIYLLFGTSFTIFVYMIVYDTHFRYTIHILPFAYMLIVGILMKINQLFTTPWQKIIIPTFIALLSILHFADKFDWVYYNYPETQFSSQAYVSIQQNIQPNKEGIISLYFIDMYMEGMGKSIKKIDMSNNKQYSINQFKRDLEQFEEGAWVTWATHKGYHLPPNLINYIVQNCGVYHGHEVDDTKVEVYYCR
ncbi:MAG: glycosyltransferase family 39 protein [Chitinophagales bacterium]